LHRSTSRWRPNRLRLEGLEDRTAPAGLHHFVIDAPDTITAGAPTALSITAYDENNQIVTDYAGTIELRSVDGQAIIPHPFTFTVADQGTHTFNVILYRAGIQGMRVFDMAEADLFGGSGRIMVVPGPLDHFEILAPNTVKAGQAFGVTVSPVDAYGNRIYNFMGTVDFNCTDGEHMYRESVTFTSRHRGVYTFGALMQSPGLQGIRVINGPAKGGFAFNVLADETAPQFLITAPAQIIAGQEFAITVEAVNGSGEAMTDFVGTVHFGSTDLNGILPSDYTFTPADQGTHTFNVTLTTAGLQVIRASNAEDPGAMFGSLELTVSPAAVAQFEVVAADVTIAGVPFNVTVTAKDEFGNIVTDYTGSVQLVTLEGAQRIDYTFTPADEGVHTFSLTLDEVGLQGFRIFDIATPDVHSGGAIMVEAGRSHGNGPPRFVVDAHARGERGNAVSAAVHTAQAAGHRGRELSAVIHEVHQSLAGTKDTNADSGAGMIEVELVLNTPGVQTISVTSVDNPEITSSVNVVVVGAEAESEPAIHMAAAGSDGGVDRPEASVGKPVQRMNAKPAADLEILDAVLGSWAG
jgi:hypothetical protein